MDNTKALVGLLTVCFLTAASWPVASDPDTEPNDSFDTAMPIGQGEQWGYVHTGDTVDYFCFTMKPESRWLINFTDKGGDKVNFTVYNYARQVIKRSPDLSSGGGSWYMTYLQGHFPYPPLTSLVYYIKAQLISGVHTACNYTINLTIYNQTDGPPANQAQVDAEDEMNLVEMNINHQTNISGAVGDLDPRDWYVLNQSGNKRVNVTFSVVVRPPFPVSDCKGMLSIYTYNGSDYVLKETTSWVSLNGQCETSYQAVGTEKIFISVVSENSSANGNGSVDYTFVYDIQNGTPPPNTAPSILITSPLSESSHTSPLVITGTATDVEDNIVSVKVGFPGTMLSPATVFTTNSYATWYTAPVVLDPGIYAVRANATDDNPYEPKTGETYAYNVTIVNESGNNTLPTFDIRVPFNHTTVPETFYVNGTSWDDVNVTNVTVNYRTNATRTGGGLGTWTFGFMEEHIDVSNTWDWSHLFNLVSGVYDLQGWALDTKGAASNIDVHYNITVSNGTITNTAPEFEIRVPVSFATVPQTFYINGSASDINGMVANVTIQYRTNATWRNGGVGSWASGFIIENTNSYNPWEWTKLYSLESGVYDIEGYALDNNAASSNIDIHYNITVYNESAPNQKPTFNIIAPYNHSRVPRSFMVNGTARDDSKVTNVTIQFRANNTRTGGGVGTWNDLFLIENQLAANPWLWENTAFLQPGIYDLIGWAMDDAGLASNTDLHQNITVYNETIAAFDISRPFNNTPVQYTFTVCGTAWDDSGTVKNVTIQYRTNNTQTGSLGNWQTGFVVERPICSTNPNPWEWQYSLFLSIGTYDLKGWAGYFQGGASNIDIHYNITILDNTPPSVNITYPKDGFRTTMAKLKVCGTASDNVAVASVKVSVNGVYFPVDGINSWTSKVNLTIGNNTITAYAIDTAGLTGSMTITVVLKKPVIKPKPPIPGFEGPLIISVMVVGLVLLGRRRAR